MASKPLRILFAGTPLIASNTLRFLLKTQHEIVGVCTKPDKPSGRGKKIIYSEVKDVAIEHNIPIFQPVSFKDNEEIIATLKKLSIDVIVVVAYGLIVPPVFLSLPKYYCINIHVSLLPLWRGAAPIQRSIQAGDKQTGVSLIRMDSGLDTGDILSQESIDIEDTDTSESVHDKLTNLAQPMLLKALDNIDDDTNHIVQNSENATYAHKINKKEGFINWQKKSADISCHIRAFTPFPGAYITIDNENIKIYDCEILESTSKKSPGTIVLASKHGLDIQTQDNILRIHKLQFAGKKILTVKEIFNGKNLSYMTDKKL